MLGDSPSIFIVLNYTPYLWRNRKMDKEIIEKLKGSTAIEINGVTFHSLQEMLIYMDKLRKENSTLKFRNSELAGQKASLERWFGEAKKIIKEFMRISVASVEEFEPEFTELIGQADELLKECEK